MAEFVDIMKKLDVICNEHANKCGDCPLWEASQHLSCRTYMLKNPEKAEKIIREWQSIDWTKVKKGTPILVGSYLRIFVEADIDAGEVIYKTNVDDTTTFRDLIRVCKVYEWED